MKQWLPLMILGMSMVLLLTGTRQGGAAVPEDAGAMAKQFVELLVKGDFTGATGKFDATMKQAMPAAQLQAVWKQLIQQVGPYKEQQGIQQEKVQQYQIVVVTCKFEKALIDVQVAYNTAGEVAGLYFRPAQAAYQPPTYAKLESFREEEVTIGTGEWALPGTLTLPKGDGPFRAVVLVHGSGPNDRDESIQPNKPFRDLAWGLATKGIAVLRYEKRTKAHQAKFTPDTAITVKEETIDDALAAVALLRQHKAIDGTKIIVLGHSLGGMLIPRIGKADPTIPGFIILAGPTHPMEDAILMQLTYIMKLDGVLSDDDKQKLDEIKQQIARIKDPALAADTPAGQLLGVPAAYWLDLRGYQPAQLAKELTQPMLILQGERDYQVTMEDYQVWKDTLGQQKNVTLKSYPALNHLFIAGTGRCTPGEYDRPGHVDAAVIDDIARWITAR